MPRQARVAPGGLIYHVLNRAAGRQALFDAPADYAAFLRALADALKHEPVRVLGFCLMKNHWHLVLWPRGDGQLARFMQRLTITHVRRWVEHKKRVGLGPVYQGRYKSFAAQDDTHLLTVLRYVERNPVRARLARRAESWRWSSLGQRHLPGDPDVPLIPIAPWPVPRRRDWVEWVNRPQTDKEEQAMQRCLSTGRPFGDGPWTARTEKRLNLRPPRPRGRPRKTPKRGGK